MSRFWLHSLSKPNSALSGPPTERSLPSLCTPTRELRSNPTVGTLFSNSRLVSLYQLLPFSTFWALKSWRLGLAQIKPAPDASWLVMILIHVHDVLQLRHQKNDPPAPTNVLSFLHPLPLPLPFQPLW